jgi:hypothetical protein
MKNGESMIDWQGSAPAGNGKAPHDLWPAASARRGRLRGLDSARQTRCPARPKKICHTGAVAP